MRLHVTLTIGILAAGCTPQAPDELTVQSSLARDADAGKRGGTATSPRAAVSPAITLGYQGGPVMLGTPDVYFIWYGNWSGNTATTILPDFMSSLGGSPYFDINSVYHDSNGNHVSGNVHYAGAVNDNYSSGTNISESSIATIVQAQLASGALPISTNAVYFVLTSPDVTMSGFCSGYCGWHENGSMLGYDIKYSFVGDAATQCPASCAPYSPAPNGNVGADGMASVLAHELEETVTDPDLNAWTDSQGESADKCAWTFGTTYSVADGGKANMRLGDRDYLIQQQLDESDGKCELSLPGGGTGGGGGSGGGGGMGGGGPTVTVTGPSPGTLLYPGGSLVITASVSDSTTIAKAIVNWKAPSGTSQFTMSAATGGGWILNTTMSTSAAAGTRSFTVTATDSAGKSATSKAETVNIY